MNLLREDLCQAFPIKGDEICLRLCQRPDLDSLASWPPYPWPYQAFDYGFRLYTPAQRDTHFAEQVKRPSRIALVCDLASSPAVGYVALALIDWTARTAGNMALRLHPTRCGSGIGTQILQLACGWWFAHGMQALRLDVAASNQRAVRCYQKAGFVRAGESWREAPDLVGQDLGQPRYDFLRDHARFTGSAPEIRFYWMVREPQ